MRNNILVNGLKIWGWPGSRMRIMRGKIDSSRKLAPLLRQAFRQGVEAATRNDDRNPYVPDTHLYHAWIAGWASLARGWDDNNDLRFS